MNVQRLKIRERDAAQRKIILDLKLSVRRKDTDISHMEKHYNEKFETEINKLKEENRKLEETHLSKFELDTESEMEEKFKKEINKLKEENRKLEDINLSILGLDTDSEIEDLKKTIRMLKSKVKKLEKKLMIKLSMKEQKFCYITLFVTKMNKSVYKSLSFI